MARYEAVGVVLVCPIEEVLQVGVEEVQHKAALEASVRGAASVPE
jgi:hypothetical protein